MLQTGVGQLYEVGITVGRLLEGLYEVGLLLLG